MKSGLIVSAFGLILPLAVSSAGEPAEGDAPWTVYVTNDNCPDYTWGYTEQQTRQAFADVVAGHLDEMARTDAQPPDNRDRYNMAVTQEALCFLEKYPRRKDELVRRVKEGRVFVSPYLCNSLWAFQGLEGTLRTFYPARRLEKAWGVQIVAAEHIEQPSLPWGVASILSGCGIRWLSVPFYVYDSTFTGLKCPPLFVLAGPDGGEVRVVMDRWASLRGSYTQGARLLGGGEAGVKAWVGHYRDLGAAYPARAILTSGTHGDIAPHSGGQARRFAEAIIRHNARPHPRARLVNAALGQFCRAIDETHARAPFLPTIRGCFGHSWDVWPVCLAKYAAAMRAGARQLLSAEALLSVAGAGGADVHQDTADDRRRAEWCWAMLGDHAWNGTTEQNKRHNADLRRAWSGELDRLGRRLLGRGWSALGLKPDGQEVTIFNPLSVPRRGLVRLDWPTGTRAVAAWGRDDQHTTPCQVVREDGGSVLYFVCPEVPGFGFRRVRLKPPPPPGSGEGPLRAGRTYLGGPHYRLVADRKTGGISALMHRRGAGDLTVAAGGRTLCQTVYFYGREHPLRDLQFEVASAGPVLARLRVSGRAARAVAVTTFVTIYAELDRVDFDVRVRKPGTTEPERLCQVFPVLPEGAVLRIETTGAVVRPLPQPAGDLLPGADTRRFAVQGFVDASRPDGPGVTIAPLDAFVLRRDLGHVTFEALGNDQNYREVLRDQHGVTDFRFRYALRAHGGGYATPEAFAWSRCAATPLLAVPGRIDERRSVGPPVQIDATRAIATCLKPADGDADEGIVCRLWEVAGRTVPLRIRLSGFTKAVRTDLLERDVKPLPMIDGAVALPLRARGFGALRLLR